MVGSDIGGNLEISRAEFAAGSHLDVQGATVKGRFFWRELGPNFKARLNLSHASVGPIADDPESWPATGNLNLDGFVYTRIGGSGPTDAKSRLEWLARQPADEFTPQPYQQLDKVLREAGDNVGARRVLVAMENSRHKYGKLVGFARPWHWLLWATIGYGYRPWYALCWGIGIVAIASVFFSFGFDDGAITPTDKDAYRVFETHYPKEWHSIAYYPEFYAPIYALDTFLPIINFGQKDHWMPNPHYGS
jgi:hypothetical protein